MEDIDSRIDKEIDSLLGDWLDRGDTYVKTRTVGRIGWEKLLEEGASYSSYFLESPTKRDLLLRAYPLARDTITAMNPPCKFSVQVSKGPIGGCTDGKTVFLKTGVFDDEDLPPSEALDVFLGIAVHEGCHLLWTDMSILKRKKIDPLEKALFNILEDERIETLCGDYKPGMSRFIEKMKYYLFDKLFLERIAPELDEMPLFHRFMNVFLSVVRYPRYVNKEAVKEFLEQFVEIRDVLTPFPKSTESAFLCAVQIADVIRDLYIEEEAKRDEEKKSGSGDVSDEGSGEGDPDDTSEGTRCSRALKRLDTDVTDFSPLLKDISASVDSDSGAGSGDVSDEITKDRGLVGELCEGRIEVGGKDTFFKKAPDDRSSYLESLSRVSRYVPAISKIIKGHCKDYRLIHRSMRSGVLDTNKLAEAIQGVPTVYLREGEVFTDKVSVCVLIDESGSMSGTRMRAAKDSAILLNEAVKALHSVELFIYGHSGDERYSGATELNVYREPGYTPAYSLGSAYARSQNRDGVAILETAQRVRKYTKNPVLMFIISDGAPCADDYGSMAAIKHTRDCVRKVEKMDFSVVQICIEASYDPKLMFNHFVSLTDMGRLSIEMGKVIKNAVLRKTKTHVR